MKEFEIVVVSPPGLLVPSLPIAASRAGARGILDLEYTHDFKGALEGINKLARYAKSDFGIKLDSHNRAFLAEVTSDLPECLKVVILTSNDLQGLGEEVRDLHRKGLTVILESTCLEEARYGEQVGVDGLIAKGHEACGRVGNETTFILLQRLLRAISLPVWAQGGIGLHTAAASYAAGAAGVILDSQLYLTRESPLPEDVKAKIATLDGTETICLGHEIGETYRLYSRPGIPAIKELSQKEMAFGNHKASKEEVLVDWRQEIFQRVGWNSLEHNVYLLGQDAAFAAPLAKQYVTVGGVVEAIREAIETHCRAAWKIRPLSEGSLLAESHGTRYPVVQGPMAQVSDVPAFIRKVAQEGALPFLALSWLVDEDLEKLLHETSDLLQGRPWGVGLLGFLPPDIYKKQVKLVTAYHPPFAMISGGRPDQAKVLEHAGIRTYLHVPTPGLLRMFLDMGVRRFVFEGQESGGHVGPLCGFGLWENMINVLLESFSSTTPPERFHVLFAGGIHDALSASMIAVMAAPLAEKGVRVGVQLGSAYLFTHEAVTTGAIVERYQKEAVKCNQTAVLETGPGHANRCLDTAYAKAFREEKRRLNLEGKATEVIRNALETMNRGRLRIASKGVDTRPDPGQEMRTLPLETLTEEEQHAHGMYLIGQLAALHNQPFTMDRLHREVTLESSERIESLYKRQERLLSPVESQRPSDIAIIGMACILPKAPNLQTYWENILNKVDAVREVPRDRWNWELYYDQDQRARDKVYSKWGAFIDDVPFDPIGYGLPPNSLSSVDPLQLLTLEAVRAALQDAGYSRRPFSRKRTSVILGISGSAELGQLYSFRSALPMFFGSDSQDICSHFDGVLPEWTEDSFPGILVNVTAGRIANRFDLGGANFTVDAACASSLASVYLAVRELENQSCDMVIVGGADTMQNPFTYLCFSKTHALSPSGRSRCLDESADGIVIGEGIAVMILKRLADAERDGDRIYAVIKGVGAGSDGRDKSLTAPGRDGQVRTLQRAYRHANISPATIELLEAHSTGTTVGDRVEIESASQVFNDAGAKPRSCAIGSVKSIIGHTKSTAGIAGLVKTALALHHKVLPPTLWVEKPNAALHSPECTFYVNTQTRPWIHPPEEYPRRAGTSAFGFGGTNYHVVLEEYTEGFSPADMPSSYQNWPSELLIWKARSRQALIEAIQPLEEALSQGANPSLGDLAFSINQASEETKSGEGGPLPTLALVVSSLEDLRQKLEWARVALSSSEVTIHDPRGIYFSEQPLGRAGKIAFLFPGQGSQYVNMLAGLAIAFPEVRELFERSDHILKGKLPEPLSKFVFPPPPSTDEEKLGSKTALAQTYIAQPAIGTASLGLFHLLKTFGVTPDMVAGHSYGEYVALSVAGVLSEKDLIVLSEARGRFIVEAAGPEPGTMAAINAGAQVVAETIRDMDGIVLANLNAPKQTIISGTLPAVNKAIERFKSAKIQAVSIPVACAFHSPIVSRASERLRAFLSGISLETPQLKVFSNTTTRPYPVEPGAIVELLAQHLSHPVDFIGEIEAMYEDGARLFVEVGPGRVLSGLVSQVLKDRTHLAVPSSQAGMPDLVQLHHLLGQLVAHGVPIKMDRLYKGRSLKRIDLNSLKKESPHAHLPETTWLINGFRARPLTKVSSAGKEGMVRPIDLSFGKERSASSVQIVSPLAGSSQEGFSSKALPSLSGDGVAEVMNRYQRTMNRFLETQKNVMLSYLRGSSVSTSAQQDLQTPLAEETDPLSSQDQFRDDVAVAATRATERTESSSSTPPVGDVVGLSEKELELQLLNIVSDRTGYPSDMLDLDVDLEAELGIDSIKRIEILGSLMQGVDPSHRQKMETEMEGLKKIKNLRGILRWLYQCIGPEARPALPESTCESPVTDSPDVDEPGDEKEESVQRFTLCAVQAAPSRSSSAFSPDGVVVITDDERGIAQSLMGALKEQGQAVALAQLHGDLEEVGDGRYKAPFDSPEGTARLLEIIRQRHGRIGGLIHLLPLKNETPFNAMDFYQWKKQLRVETKSLFYLVKGMGEDMDPVIRKGSRFVVAATAMGGRFGSDPARIKGHFFPGQGGIGGLLKTLALEWPDVRVKAIDLNLEENASDLANHLLTEMTLDDQRVEIGYDDSQRLILKAAPASMDMHRSRTLNIDPSWVVLVTGGARGITANVALELAKRYHPTLILVGRSALPSPEEPPETVGLNTAKEIKAALISQMGKEGKSVSLPQVEAVYHCLLKEREIRCNLLDMQNAGAKVQYFQCDVRDEQAFGDLIDEVYRTYGRLDGVINGAGIIEDKLVRDKTAESFDRVFDTKVDSAYILSRKLRPESLKFLVFFTSVAGRFGNPGQGDYAAANEVVNKLAVYLDNHWPGRVAAISWGPWAKGGMVTPELQRQFAHRGIRLIPPSIGAQKLDQELSFGKKGEVEITVGGVDGWDREKERAVL